MNKVVMMGRLTKDPELRYTSGNNTAVCSFTLAVDKPVKSGQEKQADFFNCQAWEKTAEVVSKFLVKGRQTLIEGRLQNRSWEDNEGKKRYATEVVVEKLHLLAGGKSDGSAGAPSEDNPLDDELPF